MDEENKLPLKRVELSLTKFNEVAIPHHLDLLRQHKANIIKYEEARDYVRVRAEQTHARRVAGQLRALLGELDALRRSLRAADRPAFDARTRRARDLTLKAIMDYLGVVERGCIALVRAGQTRTRHESAPMSMTRSQASDGELSAEGAGGACGSAVSTDSVGVVTHLPPEQIQLQVDEQELELRSREAALRGWGELQAELLALHDAWQTVQAAALAHREQVSAVADNVEVAADNVQEARSTLAVAESLRAGAYGLGGAVAGALMGGPLGLVLGAKAGAAALVTGSALGYVAARVLGRRRQGQLSETEDDKQTVEQTEEKKDI